MAGLPVERKGADAPPAPVAGGFSPDAGIPVTRGLLLVRDLYLEGVRGQLLGLRPLVLELLGLRGLVGLRGLLGARKGLPQRLAEGGLGFQRSTLDQRLLRGGDHAPHHVAADGAPRPGRHLTAVTRLVPALQRLGLRIRPAGDFAGHLVLELLQGLPGLRYQRAVALLANGHVALTSWR